MDRSHLAALRGRAQQLISLKDRAVAVASYVSGDLPTARAVHMGIEAGSVRLIDTSTITWPYGLYLHAEFAEDKDTILATVQSYTALINPLVPLLDKSANAASGRLFSFLLPLTSLPRNKQQPSLNVSYPTPPLIAPR